MLSGHVAVPLTDEEQKDQNKNFSGHSTGFVRLSPGNWFLMKNYVRYMDKYYTFEFKPTDVVVATYPKCGTTWMQEIVWAMRNNPDLNNPKVSMAINVRCPYIEVDPLFDAMPELKGSPLDSVQAIFSEMCPGKDPKDGIFLQIAEASPEPRTIKSHLPFSLVTPNMLDTCKVVYVARNPKDLCISYYHHSRTLNLHGYMGNFDQFVDYFVKDELLYSPYGTHLTEAWQRRNHKNLHFVFFENLKADPKKEILALNDFLETNLTDKQIENVVDFTSFKSMKSRSNLFGGEQIYMNEDVVKAEGGFFRKGETGGYKDMMTPEQEQKIEEWIKRTAGEVPFKF